MQAGREIKFRAWDTVQDKMLPVESIDFRNDVISLDEGDNSISDSSEMFILMQFTGLQDKNSTDIYEGDVGEKNGVLYLVTWVNHSARFGVKIIKSDHVLIRGVTFPLHQYVNEDSMKCNFVVIGNIYENPELLEVDK